MASWGWQKPLLTDSGGFQVFSLQGMRKITEEGVRFASPIDGAKLFLTPEISMQIQTSLNSDVVMVFDECTPYKIDEEIATHEQAGASMRMSARWAQRSKDAFQEAGNPNALFGIVQGGMYEDLRDESLQRLVEIGFTGTRLAACRLANPRATCEGILADIRTPNLPHNRPRYLMGVGTPEDLVQGVTEWWWICSIASCQRGMRAMAGCLRKMATLRYAMPNTAMTPAHWMINANATPANIFHALTCTTCSEPRKSPARG